VTIVTRTEWEGVDGGTYVLTVEHHPETLPAPEAPAEETPASAEALPEPATVAGLAADAVGTDAAPLDAPVAADGSTDATAPETPVSNDPTPPGPTIAIPTE
jgi:hypothetical protein